MSTIAETEQEVIDEFAMFDQWEDKYQYLIDLAKSLAPMPDVYKSDDRLIRGCQSRVWLHSALENGVVVYQADSDAIITKGLVALMVRVLSGHPAQEIVDAPINVIKAIGLNNQLSPTRANGLLAMIKQMKLDALALTSKQL